MTFNEGDKVYRVYDGYPRTVTPCVVERTTKKLAILNGEKYDRETGRCVPRPTEVGFAPYISPRTPDLDDRFWQGRRRHVEYRLIVALRTFEAGDDETEIRAYMQKWMELGRTEA